MSWLILYNVPCVVGKTKLLAGKPIFDCVACVELKSGNMTSPKAPKTIIITILLRIIVFTEIVVAFFLFMLKDKTLENLKLFPIGLFSKKKK